MSHLYVPWTALVPSMYQLFFFFLSLSLHAFVVFLYLVSYPFYEELGNS